MLTKSLLCGSCCGSGRVLDRWVVGSILKSHNTLYAEWTFIIHFVSDESSAEFGIIFMCSKEGTVNDIINKSLPI